MVVALDADHGRRGAGERLFADDRFARLPRFLVDQEGDARTDPEGRPPRSAIFTTRRPPASPRSGSRAFGIILPTLQDSIYLPFVEGARDVFESERRGLSPADHRLCPRARAAGDRRRCCRSASGDPAAVDRAHAGHRKVAGVAPHPADRGRQPAEAAASISPSAIPISKPATSPRRRLIEIGRRQIAIICGYVGHTSNARDRLDGYRKAMTRGGARGFRRADRRNRTRRRCRTEVACAGCSNMPGTFDGLVVAGEIWAPPCCSTFCAAASAFRRTSR